jgi:hypothetical protein
MKLKVKLIVLILIVGMTIVPAILASEKSPTTQTVVFTNSKPGITALGLVKFTLNEKNELINYVIVGSWNEKKKVIWLEPGYYGVTQYCQKFNRVINYRNFWVKNKSVLIEM